MEDEVLPTDESSLARILHDVFGVDPRDGVGGTCRVRVHGSDVVIASEGAGGIDARVFLKGGDHTLKSLSAAHFRIVCLALRRHHDPETATTPEDAFNTARWLATILVRIARGRSVDQQIEKLREWLNGSRDQPVCSGLVVTVLRGASGFEVRLETHCLDDGGYQDILLNLMALGSHKVAAPLIGHRCPSGWTREVVRALGDQAATVAHLGPVPLQSEVMVETTLAEADVHLTTRLNEAGVAVTIIRQGVHGDSVTAEPDRGVVAAHTDRLRILAGVWHASVRLGLADPLGEP